MYANFTVIYGVYLKKFNPYLYTHDCAPNYMYAHVHVHVLCTCMCMTLQVTTSSYQASSVRVWIYQAPQHGMTMQKLPSDSTSSPPTGAPPIHPTQPTALCSQAQPTASISGFIRSLTSGDLRPQKTMPIFSLVSPSGGWSL